jgi:hypothetical protein
LLADALLVVHFAIAAFILGGLIAVWVGAALAWGWVRNPWFRYLHLGAIAFVALEALAGIACPLTVWEDLLRGGGGRMTPSYRAGCIACSTTARRSGCSRRRT